ncbi:MAG: 16S rRNA (uracil(1498)-N(3))-methyltransferase [Deltaproteobacteria bacterium]|nr:MAG: 16S rRNA (uracil(1498)-N(3))-methyltransferase [Deltaproteobacteria bacterium]
MRRFFAAPLPREGRVRLGDEMSHHLLRVVRIAAGEQVELFDGEGLVATATLIADDEGVAELELTEAPRRAAPVHARHLLVGIPKGQAMDLAVRLATEAGATHIHPLLLSRSIAKGDRGDRWERIASSAAQQCGRGDVPEILPLATLEQASERLGACARFVAHPGGARGSEVDGPAALLVGPEGGLTDDELRRASALGFARMGLGEWVFRTETACAVGMALLG